MTFTCNIISSFCLHLDLVAASVAAAVTAADATTDDDADAADAEDVVVTPHGFCGFMDSC